MLAVDIRGADDILDRNLGIIQIQVGLFVQEHTASAYALGVYGAGNTFQVQIRAADQIGRSS